MSSLHWPICSQRNQRLMQLVKRAVRDRYDRRLSDFTEHRLPEMDDTGIDINADRARDNNARFANDISRKSLHSIPIDAASSPRRRYRTPPPRQNRSAPSCRTAWWGAGQRLDYRPGETLSGRDRARQRRTAAAHRLDGAGRAVMDAARVDARAVPRLCRPWHVDEPER